MSTKTDLKDKKISDYYSAIKKKAVYDEEYHCKLLLKVFTDRNSTPTVASYCTKAIMADSTFYKWLDVHETFYECYRFAIMVAKYNWEQEGEDNRGDPDWDKNYWEKVGNIRFSTSGKRPIRLAVNEKDSPYEQYQQLMKQASRGDFTSDELKQVMECLNSGTNVYNSFKVQQEVDAIRKDVDEIGAHNGNNIIPITSA